MIAQAFDTGDLTAGALLVIYGFLQGLLFEYVPKLSPWYARQETTAKKAVQAGGLALVVGVAFGLSCADIVNASSCDQNGVISMLLVWVLALATNQGGHAIFKREKYRG